MSKEIDSRFGIVSWSTRDQTNGCKFHDDNFSMSNIMKTKFQAVEQEAVPVNWKHSSNFNEKSITKAKVKQPYDCSIDCFFVSNAVLALFRVDS